MYGGDGPDVGRANKASGHELKSLDAICNAALELGITRLNVPLMALIDHRGFRLVALALLPIGKDTLVLGSNDGGTTVCTRACAVFAFVVLLVCTNRQHRCITII